MDFNFNTLGTTSFVNNNTTQYLKAYEIHDVNLTKIEKTEIKGSKDPNAVYPVVALEFTGIKDSHGVFTTNLFIPNPDSERDTERPTFQNANGHDYKRPSRMENFQYTLMQLVQILNPEGAKKIIEASSKIKTVDQFVDLVVKALASKTNVDTKLKLVGRNSNGTVYASLPNACGLDKKGQLFPVNFVGDNLFFSNYELDQQKARNNATPTEMEDTKDDDINVDDIDIEL